MAGGAPREAKARSLEFTHSVEGSCRAPYSKEWYLAAVRASNDGERGTRVKSLGKPAPGVQGRRMREVETIVGIRDSFRDVWTC